MLKFLLSATFLWSVCCNWAVLSTRGAEPSGRVYRDKVQPHWLADNSRFWYRVNVAQDSYQFVLVDPAKGLRQPAFDHARLAQSLVEAGVKEARPERLPLDGFDFEPAGDAIHFRAGGKSWRWLLANCQLQPAQFTNSATSTSLPLDRVPRASFRTGEETSLTFINHTAEEARLFWLSTEGQRQEYGKLRPGERREQHTFAGHVWLATNPAGKTIGVFQADELATDADITGQAPPSSPPPGLSRRNRRPSPSGLSPDGRWRASIRDFNVVLQNVQSGEETRLSTEGTAEDGYSGGLYWSPDSKKLAVLRTKDGDHRKVYLVESSPKDQLQPRLLTLDYPKPGDRLPIAKPHLFNIEARCDIPVEDSLFANPWSLSDLRWEPDSARFTFLFNQRGHQVLRIVAVDANTGKAKAILEEQSRTFIDYSGKMFCEYLDDSREILWMSERDGWNHLYLYDAQTGTVKNQITKGEWVVRGVERVDRERRQIWFRAGGIRPEQDPYYVHFCRVNFDGTGLVVLTEGDGTHSLQFSPDRRYFIDTWSRVDRAPVNELRRSEDGSLACKLEEADSQELQAGGWRPPERFVAKGRDGQTDIYGIIHWPQPFDPHKKYPVVESIYAGPQDSFVPKSFHVSSGQQDLTRRGFVVVQLDGMGTSNRSKKFHDVCWKNLGDAGFPDRILWLKAAASRYPCLDLSRVGIYGTSAGGQSALRALLAHGDFYRVAVADCGCHDNRMDKIWWNEQWMGWPIGAEYAEQSNVTQAHQLQGKLLLVVGELDKNVDPASSMQVVNALIKADKDFDLLVMPGAGHGVLGTPYGHRRMLDFFVKNLN